LHQKRGRFQRHIDAITLARHENMRNFNRNGRHNSELPQTDRIVAATLRNILLDML